MSVLVDKNTRLVVQGITGSAGGFHARQCMEYGTNVVAGVTPGKGGQKFDDKVPVFDTVAEARRETGCNVSMIFVPAPAAADSILEAVDADVDLDSLTGLKSIHGSACGMTLSTTSCQSAQPVGSGLFNSISPLDLPFFRETSS